MSAAENLATNGPELSADGPGTYALIRRKDLPFVDKAILKEVAMRIGAEGSMWTTHDRLAGDAGCARSTAQDALDRLEERGLLLVYRPKRTTLRRPSNHYAINLAAVRALPDLILPAEPEDGDPDAPEWVKARRTQETRSFSDSPPAGPSIARQPGHASPAGRAVDSLRAGLNKTLSQNPDPKPRGENVRASAPPPAVAFDQEAELTGDLESEPEASPASGKIEASPSPVVDPSWASDAGQAQDLAPASNDAPEAPAGATVTPLDLIPVADALTAEYLAQWEARFEYAPDLAAEDRAAARSVAQTALLRAGKHLAKYPNETRTCRALAIECVVSWVSDYFAKPGSVSDRYPTGYLAHRRWPLHKLPEEIDSFDLPRSWRPAPPPPAPKPAEPRVSELPDSDLPPPAHLRGRARNKAEERAHELQGEANRRATLRAVPAEDRARFEELYGRIYNLKKDEKAWLKPVMLAAHRAVFKDDSVPAMFVWLADSR